MLNPSQIVAAIAGPAATVVVALIPTIREIVEKRKRDPDTRKPAPRPGLVFVSILALGIGLTALLVTVLHAPPTPPVPQPQPKLDLKVAVVDCTLYLGLLPGAGKPEVSNEREIVRYALEAETEVTITGLEDRRIVSLSWAPTQNVYSIVDFATLNFEPSGDNRVKLTARAVKKTVVTFSLTILHVPE